MGGNCLPEYDSVSHPVNIGAAAKELPSERDRISTPTATATTTNAGRGGASCSAGEAAAPHPPTARPPRPLTPALGLAPAQGPK